MKTGHKFSHSAEFSIPEAPLGMADEPLGITNAVPALPNAALGVADGPLGFTNGALVNPKRALGITNGPLGITYGHFFWLVIPAGNLWPLSSATVQIGKAGQTSPKYKSGYKSSFPKRAFITIRPKRRMQRMLNRHPPGRQTKRNWGAPYGPGYPLQVLATPSLRCGLSATIPRAANATRSYPATLYIRILQKNTPSIYA